MNTDKHKRALKPLVWIMDNKKFFVNERELFKAMQKDGIYSREYKYMDARNSKYFRIAINFWRKIK